MPSRAASPTALWEPLLTEVLQAQQYLQTLHPVTGTSTTPKHLLAMESQSPGPAHHRHPLLRIGAQTEELTDQLWQATSGRAPSPPRV